jgi:hypothetical protein
MVPKGQGGGHEGKLFLYWKESFKMKHLASGQFQSNLVQTYILHDGINEG